MSGTSELMRFLIVALVIGNLLALAGGVLLLLAPQSMINWLGLRRAHPLSMRRVTKSLETLRDIDAPIMRYARVLGIVLCAGGLYVLIKWSMFVATLTLADGARLLARLFPNSGLPLPMWEWLWLVLLLLVFIGAVLALAVGTLAFVRADWLKRLSTFSNRWVSTRQAAKPIAKPYYGIDRLVALRPQVWGGVLVLLSCYTLVMILWFSRALL